MNVEEMKEFAARNDIKLCLGAGNRLGFMTMDVFVCPHCGAHQSDDEFHMRGTTEAWDTFQCDECQKDIMVLSVVTWCVFGDVDVDDELSTFGEGMCMCVGDVIYDWSDRAIEW